MPDVRCPECEETNREQPPFGNRSNRGISVVVTRPEQQEHNSQVQLEGILTCLDDGHRRPIKIINNTVDATAPTLPITEAERLPDQVPPGLIQDIQEAERAHFSQGYKAAVVMCRRAMQLALIDRGIRDGPLGPMLEQAKQDDVLKDERAYALAQGIKDYGDGGAHRLEEFTDSEVRAVVFAAVNLLEAIYPSAPQTGTGSNEE